MAKPFKRLLLTGAAGNLGKVLRPRLAQWADVVRLSDIVSITPANSGEEVVQCDLSDKAAVNQLLDGVDAVLHFGGISTENTFEAILKANIQGTYNIYEAAHLHGVRRIVFASSNHAVGFYEQNQFIDAFAPTRPDGMYGLSKVFGEQLGRYYYDRAGIETVCIRIGSSYPEPANPRMMASWLSYDDLQEALRCSLFTRRVGFTVLFGTSDNPVKWWDNKHASHLGFHPHDSSVRFLHLFPESGAYPDPDDPMVRYVGGTFVTTGPIYE
ncbi:uronate dehydrogenase [Duganella sp. CF402]|uniref:NAD-dependent epimerase/dehydratase family protein n=1 Tax=unclassified Duganella TaxID=2636909 RepID=UPI0008CC3A18|nr:MULTISPECIES: NAD(P)-dependent oxidoreductase [unclassified Duganella]RZT08214.1 uronate dehydrogenase [Duganella sp. BK701]SEM01912.1 uronate dehydrogenase [Duganella sp. CF402]